MICNLGPAQPSMEFEQHRLPSFTHKSCVNRSYCFQSISQTDAPLLQNAEAEARIVSDWSKCLMGVIFWQWWMAFVWVLYKSPKSHEFNRRPQEFWRVDTPPTPRLRYRLRPPAEGRWAPVQHKFLWRHSSGCLLEFQLPPLSPDKTNKGKEMTFLLIPFYVVAWGSGDDTERKTLLSPSRADNIKTNWSSQGLNVSLIARLRWFVTPYSYTHRQLSTQL